MDIKVDTTSIATPEIQQRDNSIIATEQSTVAEGEMSFGQNS